MSMGIFKTNSVWEFKIQLFSHALALTFMIEIHNFPVYDVVVALEISARKLYFTSTSWKF